MPTSKPSAPSTKLILNMDSRINDAVKLWAMAEYRSTNKQVEKILAEAIPQKYLDLADELRQD